ncbi:flagellar basal body P-ring formation chaperone FlgA [Paraburkholderia sp. SARCC-3016]|uniref:flagellar basal body P-ring formation chaperone FlgA n=1 Tax=Paraburkholderia sp. SARCC-3016 TaxID=3058611 RepID=UPI0028087774|nr:flagellar basal body P-ring formation chaperone FlgA [Paraburkholderia sp. SARCC-3016]MDQ7979099.1 flagellar basal body P-ring formation chaperone FlgA [Paraburkholderia sp. SARCC-3016]
MTLPAFAALPGVVRAARLHGVVRQGSRAWRVSSVAAVLGMALPGAGLPFASIAAGAMPTLAYAQDNGGPIVIPGPGEKNPADAQALAARMGLAAHSTQPGAAALAALRPTPAAQRALDADNGQIVIPGTGEPGAQLAPGAYAANATSGTVTSGRVMTARALPAVPVTLQRVSVQPPAQGVAPVVVSNAQARYSVPASDFHATDTAAASAPIQIDPLAARGEPPQLGGAGGSTAAVRTQPTNVQPMTAEQANAAQIRAAQQWAAQAAAPAPQRPAQTAQLQPVRYTPPRAALANGTGQSVATVNAGGANTLAASASDAAPVPAGQQDGETIRATALAFLQQQTAGLPGKITIDVARPFPRGLAACTALEPFMPVGARLWGRTSVGVRCAGARPWTLYLQARISLQATYYTASRQIAPGEMLTAADLVAHEGDLATLPQTVITDPSQAVGAVALVRIGAGLPLRQDTIRSAASVTAGQTVRVVASGEGFSISAEGSAMNNATPGQQVRVKTTNGQIVTGVVKDGSTVEIQM